jgi:hypothetical protein
MSRRSITIALASMLASAPYCAAVDRGLPPPDVPAGFGVNIHFTDPGPEEMDRFSEAGFGLIRMDLGWEFIERSPGRYDFSAHDRLLGHLEKAGARAIFILDYGNRLYDRGQAPRSKAARAAFTRFAAAAARHFQGRGVIWEIWNEPNIEQFWKPTVDAEAYGQLALETAKAVRAADPRAIVLAPGSSEFPWPFFESLFASGLLEEISAVSVHPYRESGPETAAADYGRLRALIARHASPERRTLPIVSSEWGYSTAKGAVNEATQAAYLTRQWLANLAAGVNTSIFYDWRDDGDNASDREHRFGTVRRNLEPKPSFRAARELIRTLRGYTLRQRLHGNSSADWKLLFERLDGQGPLIVAEWSADPSADEPRHTPAYRKVASDSPDFPPLKKLASIRFAPGPLVEAERVSAKLDLTLANRESQPARITVEAAAAVDVASAQLEVAIQPAGTASRSLMLPTPPSRALHRQVALKLSWNHQELPAIAPLDVWRMDPVLVTLAPRAGTLEAIIRNPSRYMFAGTLVLRTKQGVRDEQAVRIDRGSAELQIRLPLPEDANQVVLLDRTGNTAVETRRARYERMQGFPISAEAITKLDSILFVDNRPQPARPLGPPVPAGRDAPDEIALKVDYRFDPGWRYLAVSTRERMSIPRGARSAIFWIEGNRSGDHLRSRFQDATGQTFQAGLGSLDWSDWRPVRVELDGRKEASHWGGANDGIPHLPLAWEALILIDSARRKDVSDRSILVAPPYYVLDGD